MSLEIRWFPPSWLQLRAGDAQLVPGRSERGETRLYIDPAYMRTYFAHYPGHIEYSKWPEGIDGLPEQLEAGDIILVTHHHKDHAKKITIDRLRHASTRVIAPKTCLAELGTDVHVVKAGDEIQMGEFIIKVVQAYNTPGGSSTRKIHHKNQGVGYLVTGGGRTVYHAGDTDFIPEMRDLGRVDAAFLPIGGTYTMDMDEAVQAALVINPSVVIPMHHLEADPLAFKQKLETISGDIRVVSLETGGTYLLD